MHYRHELQNTGNNSCVSCLGWRWHGIKTIFMPSWSSAQRSVAAAWKEKGKQVVSRVRGSMMMLPARFLHSGVVQVLKAGQVDTKILSAVLTVRCSLVMSDLLADPNQTVYRGAQNRLNNSRVKLCHMRLWQVELFQLWWRRRTTSAEPFSRWSQCECPTSGPERWWFPGTWMTPLQSQCCSWWWVRGVQGGFLLKSTIISTVLSVFSSRLLWLHQTAICSTSCL